MRPILLMWVLWRWGVDRLMLPRWCCLSYVLMPWSRRSMPRGERLTCALEHLGPLFVKWGQLMSVRRDMIPDDIAEALSTLQDRVRPFPINQAMVTLAQAWGRPAEETLAYFDEEPLAAASIAQVHAARLYTGEAVVVKILRPGVRQQIARDVRWLKRLARCVAWTLDEQARADVNPEGLVDEVAWSLSQEVDLMQEAANAQQLRRHAADQPDLVIPKIHWSFCRHDVLVAERVYGLRVDDREALEQAGLDQRALAARGVALFFEHVLAKRFFHADMHPGNIMVDVSGPKPRFILVDFGIVGMLNERDQYYIAQNFLAFFRQDYEAVAQLHIDSGWVPADTRLDHFESAIRAVCEPVLSKPLKEISMGKLFLELFRTARRFHTRIQPQLILLQKTLFQIEALGRALDPDLDLWATVQPCIEAWVKQQVGWRAFGTALQEGFPRWSRRLPELPDQVSRLIDHCLQAETSPPRVQPSTAPSEGISWWGVLAAVAVLGWVFLQAL